MTPPHPMTTAATTVLVGCAVAFGITVIRPAGVDVVPVLLELGTVLAAVAMICSTLFYAAVPRGTPDRLGNTVRSTSIVLIIVTVGGGLRAAIDVDEATQISDNILIDRPDLGPGVAWLRPNLRGATILAPDRPHNPQDLSASDRLERTTRTRVFKVDTNQAGFRGPEFRSKRAGTQIGVLGDSFTFGWGVPYPQAWPAQLESITDVETLNLGIPAANLGSLTTLAEHRGSSWDADIVLVCEWPMLTALAPVTHFVAQIERIKAAVAPARVAVVLPAVSSFDPLGADIPPGLVTDLRRALNTTPLLDLNEPIAAAGGTGVVLRRQGRKQWLVEVPSQAVLLEAEAAPDRIAEAIIQALEADHSLVEPLFFDGGHTTAEGNTVVARATASWLKRLGWIQ